MGQHEDKCALLRKYYTEIATGPGFYIKENIPSKSIDNAIKRFASGLDRKTIIGFYDTTITENGKCGYIFTDTKVVYREIMEKPKKIWYDDIKEVSVHKMSMKDCHQELRFTMKDGNTVKWTDSFLNKTPLCNFFNDVINIKLNTQSTALLSTAKPDGGKASASYNAMTGGLGTANYGQVNKLFEEERFNSSQGHGFAAEKANTLYDKIKGRDASILGDDNAKNGADRVVDGVHIQSKYCQTGSKCISECFEDGKYRYMINNKPMQVEVPSDKYEEAVRAMQQRISNGQVPGVTDPADAEKFVRKGDFTYKQALNLAKAGTIESLTYDAVNGAVIASTAFGVTATITLATNIWNGEDFGESLKMAASSSLKVSGMTFASSVLASQLSKMGLSHALLGSSEAIIAVMGPKASAFLINAFRGASSKIYGAAAMKSAAKLLRGNIITAGSTVVVMSTVDVVNIFRGRISGKQLFKNIVNSGATVGAGTAGWVAGAAAGSAILPGVGTIIGGLIGSIFVGGTAAKVTNSVVGAFVEDDAIEMLRIIQTQFTELAGEYLLNQKEGEKAVDALAEKINGKNLMDMFATSDKDGFARDMITPIIENEVSKREPIKEILDDEMFFALKSLLEDFADNMESA